MEKTLKGRGGGVDLINGPITKSLLAFAIPVILTNVIQQFYSMVDLMVVGKFVGSIGTVGVSTGGEMADLMTPIATGFASAGQIYISQLFGAGDHDRIKKTINTLLSFLALISVVLTVGIALLSQLILSLLNCPGEALSQATMYLLITTLGFPAIFGYNAICGILRGMGESKRPLLFITIAAIINIVMDLLLVVVFPLEAAGTAIATILSQYGSCIAALIYLLKNKERFGFSLRISALKMERHTLWIIVKLAIPQVVRSTLVRFSLLWVNSNINSYGMTVSATNGVGNKVQKFADVFSSGVDTAAAAMIGQNLGAKKPDRAKKVVWTTLWCSLVTATCIAMVCLFLPKQTFSLFSNDAAVLELGKVYLRIMIIHFYVSAIIGAFQAMVTGCGFVSLGFLIGMLDGVICKIGLSIIFVRFLGMNYEGYFLGIACSRILPAVICIAYFFSNKWRTRKLLSDK